MEEVLALKNSSKGVIFLPNHPAEIDPVILMSIVGSDFSPRSVVVEHFYYLKWFKHILDFCRVVPVPSMEENAGAWKKKELAKALTRIGKEMEAGENYIIYPAGKLKLTSIERIGGASFVHSLLSANPWIKPVLVRTTGLWGSSFSTYATGSSPDFGKTLAQGLKAVLKGGIFFVPKRKVLLEFELLRALPEGEDKLGFNRFLESWYNRYPESCEEPLSCVPYSRFGSKNSCPLREKANEGEQTEVSVSPKIETDVISYLAALAKKPKETISQKSHLAFDLGLDSLDIAEIHAFLDKKYEAGAVSLGSLKKVSDVLLAIVNKERNDSLERKEEESHKIDWFEKARKPLNISEAETIIEVFLDSCDRMGSNIACADATSGLFSYKKLKRSVLILAEEFKRLPGKRVGVLLPSSGTAYICILALMLAGKVPVMVNWTAGRTILNGVKKVGEFEATITSKRFLNKIYLEDLGDIEDTFVLLENVKEGLSLGKKIKGLRDSFLSRKALIRKFGLDSNGSEVAVLLFTTGTEGNPKAVPLFHRHILANQRSGLAASGFNETDSLYGILPPFHSFGFSLTGLFPLLAGLKVFYSPDPTDGHRMAAEIDKMKITTICLAPSFIRNLFSSAKIEQLGSLKLIVSGAEKPSPELPLFVKKNLPGVKWIEGYGITECSPIVSLQPIGEEPKGVGKLFPGVEAVIIDPVSLEPLADPEVGEICLRGPSVFEGYLGDVGSPFLEIAGKKWYKSGDLGRVDKERNLYLSDRLKRIVKIGGEIVSLGGVEAELIDAAKEERWYDPSGTPPGFAVLAGKGEKPEILLCTTLDLPKEDVNAALRQRGVGRLVKIARVYTFPEIPLTGTGKINYRMLEEKIRCIHVEEHSPCTL